jgi:hypothetical protein
LSKLDTLFLREVFFAQFVAIGDQLAPDDLAGSGDLEMVLRIERVSRRQLTILRLSGRLQSEHVEELKTQIEASAQRVVLDLEGVKLVDPESVCFLAACETDGVELSRCSPYIRNWISREKASRRADP